MKIKNITFQELEKLDQNKEFGIVITGAGGKLQDWIDGITKMLKDEEIFSGKTRPFKFAAIISGNVSSDGRTDLFLSFNSKCKINVVKLALWRIRMGDISWIEDFVVNYRKDYE